jgi:hypothetical protein
MVRPRLLCAHLVNHHVFDKPRAGPTQAVDFDRGVKFFDCAGPLDSREQERSKQLGLTLQSRKDPVDVLVIDHAEKIPRR